MAMILLSVVEDFHGFGIVEFLGGFKVVLAADDKALVFAEAGTGGNEVTADNVLLHALEQVGLALDSGFVEDLGGFLERGGRHET